MSGMHLRVAVEPKVESLTGRRNVTLSFTLAEYERLEALATSRGATVEEYVRACALGPHEPADVELAAEVLLRETSGSSGEG